MVIVSIYQKLQGISAKAPTKAEAKEADEKPKATTKAASPKSYSKKETTKKVVAKT